MHLNDSRRVARWHEHSGHSRTGILQRFFPDVLQHIHGDRYGPFRFFSFSRLQAEQSPNGGRDAGAAVLPPCSVNCLIMFCRGIYYPELYPASGCGKRGSTGARNVPFYRDCGVGARCYDLCIFWWNARYCHYKFDPRISSIHYPDHRLCARTTSDGRIPWAVCSTGKRPS